MGFEGGEPLNITFTMARPLPIYPLKVPSYLLLPEARSSLLEETPKVIGWDSQSIATDCGHHSWPVGLCTVHPYAVYRAGSPSSLQGPDCKKDLLLFPQPVSRVVLHYPDPEGVLGTFCLRSG